MPFMIFGGESNYQTIFILLILKGLEFDEKVKCTKIEPTKVHCTI